MVIASDFTSNVVTSSSSLEEVFVPVVLYNVPFIEGFEARVSCFY